MSNEDITIEGTPGKGGVIDLEVSEEEMTRILNATGDSFLDQHLYGASLQAYNLYQRLEKIRAILDHRMEDSKTKK